MKPKPPRCPQVVGCSSKNSPSPALGATCSKLKVVVLISVIKNFKVQTHEDERGHLLPELIVKSRVDVADVQTHFMRPSRHFSFEFKFFHLVS